MRYALILVLFSAACAPVKIRPPLPLPPVRCTTTCGLQAPQETPDSCRRLQLNEDRILTAYAAHVKGWARERTCPALATWKVLVAGVTDEQGGFSVPWGADGKGTLMVLGQTHHDSRVIVLGTNRWRESALAHELAHVFRHQLDGWSTKPGDWNPEASHWRWTPLGICSAINEASDLKDDCAEPHYLGAQ